MNLLDLWRSLTQPAELSPAAHLNLEFRCTACGAAYTRPVRRVYVDLAVSRRNQRQDGPGRRDEFHIPEVIVCPACQAADAYELAPSVFGQVTGALMRSALGANDPDAPIQFLNREPEASALPAQRHAAKRPAVAGAAPRPRPPRKRKKR